MASNYLATYNVDGEQLRDSLETISGLGGHPKSGQWRSPQNRPIENSQDKGSYSALEGAPASISFGGIWNSGEAMAN